MKKVQLLFMFLLITFSTANDITPLYQKLYQNICKNESIVKCDKNAYLAPNKKFFKLDNEKLLLFFHIENPNDSPYTIGINNALVIFDKNGKGEIVHTLSGSIDLVSRDPHGGIWLEHPWQIEGTTPSLSFSSNGLVWQNITLPAHRPRLSIEFMSTCLLQNRVALNFSGEDKHSYWMNTYSNILQRQPLWKEINAKTYGQLRCLNADALHNHWYYRQPSNLEEQKVLSFYNNLTHVKLTIPRKIVSKSKEAFYTIQVGYFKFKKSIRVVRNDLNNIGYPLTTQPLANHTYKLFLGEFSQQEEVKEALRTLKKRYQQNRYIQGAFVTRYAN